MLYYLYYVFEELKTVEDIDFEMFIEVYDYCCIVYVDIYPSDYYKKFLFLIDIDEFEENLNGEDNIVYSDWKELVG